MSRLEFQFYEWLIIEKKLDNENFELMTLAEFEELKQEFLKVRREAIEINCEHGYNYRKERR